jgi:hypothetical protein
VPEPLRLDKWDDVREHFRAVHLPNIIKSVERQVAPATRARRSGSRELQRHVIQEIEQQRRFPLKMVTTLSQQFASHGLQFFKVNKTIVHVAVARPHYLDVVSEPVSEGVKRIVNHVEQHPRCTVKDLVDALAPVPAPPAAPVQPAAAPAEGRPTAEPKTTHHEPTPEQKAVLADLHWLVHSGHVIEFANGELETAKKPLPKPPPPAPKKKTPPPAPVAAAEAAAPIAGNEEQPGVVQDSTPPQPPAESREPAPAAQVQGAATASSAAESPVQAEPPADTEPPKESGSPG